MTTGVVRQRRLLLGFGFALLGAAAAGLGRSAEASKVALRIKDAQPTMPSHDSRMALTATLMATADEVYVWNSIALGNRGLSVVFQGPALVSAEGKLYEGGYIYPDVYADSASFVRLGRGESIDAPLTINLKYDIEGPGAYTVQASFASPVSRKYLPAELRERNVLCADDPTVWSEPLFLQVT